jgi:Cu/Ag efflux protein CusF
MNLFSKRSLIAASLASLSLFTSAAWAQNTPGAASPEWTNAEVTRLQLDRNRVTVKHERIASIKMDAMTMPFKLKDKAMFESYKVGDKVQIVVKNDDGNLFITQVRKAQ